MDKFKIYFRGEIVDGIDTQDGQRSINKVFKNYTESDRLARKKILVKKNLNKKEAALLVHKFKRLGLKVLVVKHSKEPELTECSTTETDGKHGAVLPSQRDAKELLRNITQNAKQTIDAKQKKVALLSIKNATKQNAFAANRFFRENPILSMLNKKIALICVPLLIFVGVGYAFVGSQGLPNCNDSIVEEKTALAIRDAYTRIGRSGFETPYIKILDRLTEVPQDEQAASTKRIAATAFKIPEENLKLCRAQIDDRSNIAVVVAKSKDGDLGYAVYNFGIPGMAGTFGWVSTIP